MEAVIKLNKPYFSHTCLQQAGFGPLISHALAARYPTAEEAYQAVASFKFLPPLNIPGIREGAELVLKAVAAQEPIMVVGDYDADGICGTAIIVRYLWQCGANLSWYLPTRADGYGLNLQAVEAAANHRSAVIIAVDCGTNDHGAAEVARLEGMKLVVVDHHIPNEQTVTADVIINPHVCSHESLFCGYCGAGLAYKLVEGMALLSGSRVPDDAIIMAGVATCADMVPLLHENRFLVKHALSLWPQSNAPWVVALRKQTGLTYPTAKQFSWVIGPILNAPGRLDSPHPSLELLLSDNQDKAAELAEKVIQANRRRQEETEAAETRLLARMPENPGRAIVLSETIPVGLAGLIAGRLAKRYRRPAIILAEEGEIWRGSGRSPEGVNILAALQQTDGHLERLGGHSAAVGLSVRPDKINAFKDALEHVLPPPEVPAIEIDAIIQPSDLRPGWVAELSLLEPYGAGNLTPLFMLRRVVPRTYRTSTGEHLQLKVGDIRLIWFGAPPGVEQMPTPWDLVFSLSLSNRMGRPEIQAIIEYAATSVYFNRETIAGLYTYLYGRDQKALAQIPKNTLQPALAVLRELNLVDPHNDALVVLPAQEKRELASSGIYQVYSS